MRVTVPQDDLLELVGSDPLVLAEVVLRDGVFILEVEGSCLVGKGLVSREVK